MMITNNRIPPLFALPFLMGLVFLIYAYDIRSAVVACGMPLIVNLAYEAFLGITSLTFQTNSLCVKYLLWSEMWAISDIESFSVHRDAGTHFAAILVHKSGKVRHGYFSESELKRFGITYAIRTNKPVGSRGYPIQLRVIHWLVIGGGVAVLIVR